MEEFVMIEEFPLYAVSNLGKVIKWCDDQPLTLSPTQHGELTVGLMKGHKQYRRSVKVLVARAFVQGETPIFDTPILLDGDRNNLNADNIVWRPRWFALEYVRQFDDPQGWWYAGPVVDIICHHGYNDIYNAAVQTGILLRDIRQSLANKDRVFPTGACFVWG